MITNTICEHLAKRIESGDVDNYGMVQIIELVGSYLNLRTIPNYAKENGKSYNGVKKHRNIVKIFDVKFVIDNL